MIESKLVSKVLRISGDLREDLLEFLLNDLENGPQGVVLYR